MWTNRALSSLGLRPSLFVLLILSTSTTAQQVGSFFTAIYINGQLSSNQVGCGSMGYTSYCCDGGQYCALDGNSQIACCASGSTCSGNVGAVNNGQYTQQSTQCACEGTTAAVQVVSTAYANCANKCGYYGQLCCAANQYCITGSNNEASCAASEQAPATTVVGVYVTPTPGTVTETQSYYVTPATTTTQATNGLIVVTTTAGASVATVAGEAGTCTAGYSYSTLIGQGGNLPATQTQGCQILVIESTGAIQRPKWLISEQFLGQMPALIGLVGIIVLLAIL